MTQANEIQIDPIDLAAVRVAMALTPDEGAALAALRARIARVVFPAHYHQADPVDMLLYALEALEAETAQPVTQRQPVIDELRDWATITGRPLPYPAETIADLEALGFCVDLADGALSWAADMLDSRVQLTPTGWAAYAALKDQVAA